MLLRRASPADPITVVVAARDAPDLPGADDVDVAELSAFIEQSPPVDVRLVADFSLSCCRCSELRATPRDLYDLFVSGKRKFTCQRVGEVCQRAESNAVR